LHCGTKLLGAEIILLLHMKLRPDVSSVRCFDSTSSRHLPVSRGSRINPEHGTRGCHVHWHRQQGLTTVLHASSVSDRDVTKDATTDNHLDAT
jgi:hypothetical protein